MLRLEFYKTMLDWLGEGRFGPGSIKLEVERRSIGSNKMARLGK